MFIEIEKAIEKYLEDCGLMPDGKIDYADIDPADLTRWRRGTVINAITTGGNHITDNYETRQSVNISVVIVAECPQSRATRHAKIALLVQAVISLLTGKDFGLDITPLLPGRFRETTPAELDEIGLICWQVDFATDYSIDILPQEELFELLGIDADYGNFSDNFDTEERQ